MGLLEMILGRSEPRAARTSGSYAPGVAESATLFSAPPTAGIAVTEHIALTYSAFWFCVRFISECLASLPLFEYRRLAGGGKERATGERLYRLVHNQPNPEMSSMVWRETMQAHVLTWGNGYSEIERDGAGEAVAFWPLPPSSVKPDRDRQGRLVYRVRYPGGDEVLGPDRILHVPGLGFDGICGYSVVAMARRAIGLGLAEERFGAGFFGNGARPGGVLSHPAEQGKPKRDELRRSWQEEHGGPDRSNRVAVLWGGWTFTPQQISPEDSQFLESRQFQREEMALWFNMPANKLGSDKASTFASAEQFAIDLVVHTIRPWLVRWEQELNRKLVPAEQQDDLFFEHLADALLRGDAASRTAALVSQFMHGAICQDEWREIENRNPIPGGLGKTFYRPAALTPVNEEPAPPAPPAPPGPTLLPLERPEEDGGGEGAARALVLAAARDVLLDVAARAVRKEAFHVRKGSREPAKFLAWMEEFYAHHASQMAIWLRPGVALWQRLHGRDSLAELCVSLAGWHSERAREQLLDTAGACTAAGLAGAIDGLMMRWETERPAALVARLVEVSGDGAG